MRVFILATCRKPELAQYTELVFKTLRVGFPTADVFVALNKDVTLNCPSIIPLCQSNLCKTEDADIIHHEWIELLIKSQDEPFIILDTDVVFYSNMENVDWSGPLMGCRIPEWQDEFSGAITRARLHTSLLYIDPKMVREKLTKFREVIPYTEFTPFIDPVFPVCLPFDGKMYFHDTMSLLYHAIGGHEFNADAKDCYFHFNFGTISDIVLPRLSNAEDMAMARYELLKNPAMGKGMWRAQEEYYSHKPPQIKRGVEIQSILDKDAVEARKINQDLCKGNIQAMEFNDLWYAYCHGIDDLIDTMKDGRPRMSAEQIIQLFINAAFLYNSPFYVKNREALLPIVILVTNQFCDSVAWEKSPINRRRIIADVMRICGDEMYFMVALLSGGWSHMRSLSPMIRERDWIGQHDLNDKPN